MPAQTYSTSCGSSAPSTSAIWRQPCCTPWQRPIVVDAAVVDRRPGVHRHRVGVVEQPRIRLSATSRMSRQKSSIDGIDALAVQDAAGADRVADALVDAVVQRDANVVCERFEPADAHAIDDIVRAFQRPPAVGRAVMRVGRRLTAIMVARMRWIIARLRSLMSVSANSMSRSSGTQSRSATSLRVNPTLPAPMIAILNGVHFSAVAPKKTRLPDAPRRGLRHVRG